MWDPRTVDQILDKPWLVVLAETLWEVKANPYLEYMSVPVRMSHWPFWDGRDAMCSGPALRLAQSCLPFFYHRPELYP